jgi:hypothetical protein
MGQISEPVGAFLRECQTFLEIVGTEKQPLALSPLELMLLGTYVRQVRIILWQQGSARNTRTQ